MKQTIIQRVEQKLAAGQTVTQADIIKAGTHRKVKNVISDVRVQFGHNIICTKVKRGGVMVNGYKLATKAAEQPTKVSVNAAPVDMNKVIDAFLIGVLTSRPKLTFWQRVRGRVVNAFRCA